MALWVGAMFAMAAPAPVWAGMVVVSTFGPGDSYQGSGSAILAGENGQSIAIPFVPDSNFTLGQVDVAMGLISGPNEVLVSIYDDVAGELGSSLVSWLLVEQLGAFGGEGLLRELPSPLQLVLLGGSTYYLVAEPANPVSIVNWNSSDLMGDVRYRSGEGPWGGVQLAPLPALRILAAGDGPGGNGNGNGNGPGGEVPEPASLALVAAGLGLTFWLRRRRGQVE
jgi:hypothetical protein